MIHIFRHIRKTLMQQNKIRTYITYALGEIILVVFGILIALQVNNWNQERLDSKVSAEFTNRLLGDMQLERRILGYVDNYLTQVEKNAKAAITVYEREAVEGMLTDSEFLISLYQASQIYDPNQISATYQEMISSGQIGMIKNEELRNRIIIYYDNDWSKADVFANESPYRESVRKEIPSAIQSEIREICGDQYVKVGESAEVILPEECDLTFDKEIAAKTATDILQNTALRSDLRFHIGNLYAQLQMVRTYKQNIDGIMALLGDN